MSIIATPINVRVDASSLVTVTAAPNRSVAWTLTGTGTLVVISDITDSQGRAHAKYVPDPGTEGNSVQVDAAYGT